MLIFGMSLGYFYLMTVVGSFCLYMSSFSFMKAVKVIPENIPVFWFCAIFSIIPILNMFFSIIFIIFSLKMYYNPEFKEHFSDIGGVKNKIKEDEINGEE